MKCWNSIIKNFEKEIKVSKLLISHHHPDHIGLSKFLSEKLNIKVYAPKNEILRAEKIINLSDKEYSQMLSNKYEEFGFEYDRGEDLYEAMIQINYEGDSIIISKLAKMLNVTPRTLHRHMCDELKKVKVGPYLSDRYAGFLSLPY